MEKSSGTITRRMDSVLNGLEKEFQSLFTKKDFDRVLEKLWAAGNQSNRPSILKKLFDMFDACGVPYEMGKQNDYYASLVKNMDIPEDYTGLEDKMLYALYTQYEEYPSPEDYLHRIVNRLRAREDHWESDTLRVNILKQFIKYGNCMTYRKMDPDTGKNVKVTIFGGEKYIKDYIKEKHGAAVNDFSEMVEYIADDIFDVLKNASKDQKKPSGKYGMLKMINDLADSRFRMEGATKRSLYLFAMVYNMTYYSGSNQEDILDYRTDIEINLFRDYYVNNLMRFLSDTYRGHLSEYELDPSGQGINYKNFAEMIYLYYISNSAYSAQDKIKLSDEMIERIQNSQVKGQRINLNHEENTAIFRGRVMGSDGSDLFSEDILSLSDEKFELYIRENYNCNTHIENHNVSPIQLETEQKTAYREYMSILNDLKDMGMDLKGCDYGLWITDVCAYEKKEFENICDRMPEIDRDRFKEFMELLSEFNSFIKGLPDKTENTVTRTSIVVAYYYYYNAIHEADDASCEHRSFEEVFYSFKSGADERLNAAYYQPISSKNLFDVLIIFSAYAYQNI